MTSTTTATTDPAVLVIGGYGAVGGGIVGACCATAAVMCWSPGAAWGGLVGSARPLAPRATAVALGERSLLAPEALPHRVTVVVNCVEEASLRIAMQCRATGICYVDISATAPVLDAVWPQWMADARQRSSAVLSVGGAPGLTNLLVREARDRLGPLRHADITVLLGAGEVHGLAAIRWMLDRLGTAFTVQTTAGQRAVRAFGEARSVWLAAPQGRRTTYRFDFSDQHTLPRTLTLQSAATWLCFDSRLVTQVLAWMARLRVRRWPPADGLAKSLAWVAAHAPVGGSEFLVQVDAVSRWATAQAGPSPGTVTLNPAVTRCPAAPEAV